MSHHVLIVDDDPEIRAVVQEILREEGYRVETAANGAEALAAVTRDRPRVVLLDMRMPVLDGWGFAQALQERGWAVPLIVMTAARSAAAWAAEIAAHCYLAKPFEVDELLATVARCSHPP